MPAICLLLSGGWHCAGTEPEQADALGRAILIPRIKAGIELLNHEYLSPTLGIWLDRPGDDLRAHYEGRLNPPWWSSANAMELLIDFMNATGSPEYDREVAQLYELNRDRKSEAPRVIAELKRRQQWSDADEANLKCKQAEAETKAREAKPGEGSGGKAEYYIQFRNEYLDDSGWWGVAWLKMYDRTHDIKYLGTAQAIHAHMAKNWNPEKNGGVMWSEDSDKQKANAITNSLFLILSARLYQRTHDAADLKWAEQTLAWFHAKALYDGIGVVDVPGHHGDYWTYNQGAFIGGLTALYEATNKPAYLEEAVQVAESVLSRSGLTLADGVIVEKLGTHGWDPGLFKGIMTRYLAHLREVLRAGKTHPETAQHIDLCLRRSAESLLKNSVAENGLFTVEWHAEAKDHTANFNTQVSALIALTATLPGQK